MAPIEPVNLSEFKGKDDVPGESGAGGNKPQKTTQKEANMPKTPEELQAENDALRAQLAEAKAGSGSAAKLSESEVKLTELVKANETLKAQLTDVQKSNLETQTKLRLGEVKSQLASLARKGKITVPIYKKVFALSEALVSTGTSVVQLGCKKKLDEGEGDGVDKLDVVESVLDVLNQLPDSIATDPEKEAVLDEDGSPDNSDDDDDKLDKEAKAAMKENPKLSYRQALVLAERKIRGGK
jgi:hypothetical protein